MIPKVMIRPMPTISTGRKRWLTYPKRRPITTIIRIIATAIRMPVDVPISAAICWENALLPVTETVVPGGTSVLETSDWMLLSAAVDWSLERPVSRVTWTIVKVFDGTYRSSRLFGTFALIAITSADEVGTVPPFACLTRSAIDATDVTCCCWRRSSSSESMNWSCSMPSRVVRLDQQDDGVGAEGRGVFGIVLAEGGGLVEIAGRAGLHRDQRRPVERGDEHDQEEAGHDLRVAVDQPGQGA